MWPRLGTAPWETTGTFAEGYIEGCYDANVYLFGMGTTFDNRRFCESSAARNGPRELFERGPSEAAYRDGYEEGCSLRAMVFFRFSIGCPAKGTSEWLSFIGEDY